MSETPKPIRRSEELAPLSREHHEGLLFAWKIRQGLRNGTDPQVISRFAQWYWTAELEEHFRKEEEVLLPHLPPDHPLVLQLLEEHQQIEAWIHINEQIPDTDLLEQLAQSVHDHIRFEERVFLPFAEQHLAPDVLREIHQHISVRKPAASPWPEAFWEYPKG